MCRTRSFMKGVLAVGLVAVLSGYGLAATQRNYTTTNERALRQDSSAIQMHNKASMARVTKLIGKSVKNTEGKAIGTVYDLVLTPGLDGISYVALSSGGFLGIGHRLHAVPWSAVQMGVGNTLVIPIDECELKQARGFSEVYWPSEGDPQWASRAGDRTQKMSYGSQTAAERETIRNRRASRIIGMAVDEPHGRAVGKVKDLVVAMDSGRIEYTIVSNGGLLGLGSKWAAVPTGAITFEPDRRFARLEVDQQTLVANSFNPAQFPDLSDPTYARDIHLAFNVEPGTTVLGYVAPEEPSATTGTVERPAARSPQPPARGTTPTAPRMPEVTAAEPTEADLTATFDPARVKTIDATILDLGRLRSAVMGRDTLWLRVRTSDGQTLTVNAGPRDYISKQDIYVVKSDRIRLTGSDVQTAMGKHVFLPTEITYENHVLKLRDSNGRPLWESQMNVPGQQPGTTTSQPSTERSTGSQTQPDETTPGITEESDLTGDEVP